MVERAVHDGADSDEEERWRAVVVWLDLTLDFGQTSHEDCDQLTRSPGPLCQLVKQLLIISIPLKVVIRPLVRTMKRRDDTVGGRFFVGRLGKGRWHALWLIGVVFEGLSWGYGRTWGQQDPTLATHYQQTL